MKLSAKLFNKKYNLQILATNLALLAFLGFYGCGTPAYSQILTQEEQMNITVYDKASPSIVDIDAELPDGVSSGTGCIVDSSGIILTSSHVIENSDDIKVTIPEGKSYKATLTALIGENNDLALLKIKPEKQLVPIKFADSTKVRVGQKVYALGNPFGFEKTLTTGIISRIDKEMNKIQTDAVINPGSSGGPLLNTNGEVIGINQSIYNPDNNRSNIGIGFAVPSNVAVKFIAVSKTSNNIISSSNKTKQE